MKNMIYCRYDTYKLSEEGLELQLKF